MADVASPAAVRVAGCFDPAAVTQLLDKCRSRAHDGQFSNADNIAVTGVLSTQLLHAQFIARRPVFPPPAVVRTLVDRVTATEPT